MTTDQTLDRSISTSSRPELFELTHFESRLNIRGGYGTHEVSPSF